MYIYIYVLSNFLLYFIFCFKQNTAYEMRISDWSSDVCSSDLQRRFYRCLEQAEAAFAGVGNLGSHRIRGQARLVGSDQLVAGQPATGVCVDRQEIRGRGQGIRKGNKPQEGGRRHVNCGSRWRRSDEHTSELQSLMRLSYAVCSLRKKRTHSTNPYILRT